jgi:negative regulator of flagellin synthesis FlgM
MKIGNPADKALGGVSPRAEGTASGVSSAKTSAASGVGESAKVTLSSAATGLMQDQDGDFDAGKVASVKQSIEQGTYKVNPQVIADKLISNARDLLPSR